MAFTLPPLPFSGDALSSKGMSAETFEYHHGKHHLAYVTNLNKLIEGTPLANASLEEIIRKADGGLFNNAAQVWNHTFFWNCLSPTGGGAPSGPLKSAIDLQWGTFEAFKTEFTNKATTLFGSGWAFLVKQPDGKLAITQEPNAGCPVKSGGKAILTLDVWEHAYYVDYRNARPKFIENFWSIANWQFAAKNFAG
jgi:Fe-Mn family superoxide dismutase